MDIYYTFFKKKTDNISFDLTGGFDTRSVFSILLNSNININKIKIHSIDDNFHTHRDDFKIASNITSKFGIKLNNFSLNNNSIRFSLKDSLYCEFYTRLGFHKGLGLENKFHKKPRFSFTGGGGGTIRGYPGMPIKKYIKELVKNVQKIKGCGKEFQKSSVRLINRSVDLLKKEKLLTNNYELSYYLYNRGPLIYHFGRASLKGFLRNWYSLQPLLDPDLKRINYDKKGKSPHDLISYIYMRFSPELIEFPIEGKRKLNVDSISKAKI